MKQFTFFILRVVLWLKIDKEIAVQWLCARLRVCVRHYNGRQTNENITVDFYVIVAEVERPCEYTDRVHVGHVHMQYIRLSFSFVCVCVALACVSTSYYYPFSDF